MSDRLALLFALAALLAGCAPLERVWYRCTAEQSGRWVGWDYSTQCERLAHGGTTR